MRTFEVWCWTSRKGLPATYERTLNKIRAGRTTMFAQKIIKWVAAARRLLTLEELREAIAVEPCQRLRNLESVVNDISQLISCCRNLVTLDEEENVVQFAHHTIKKIFAWKAQWLTVGRFPLGSRASKLGSRRNLHDISQFQRTEAGGWKRTKNHSCPRSIQHYESVTCKQIRHKHLESCHDDCHAGEKQSASNWGQAYILWSYG